MKENGVLRVLALLAGLTAFGLPCAAQNTITVGGKTYDVGADSGYGTAEGTAVTFSADQLQQIVSPIALYPDSLVSQILIASTYPSQVVEAYQWIQGNPNVPGSQAQAATASMGWDPSVQSLLQFPQIVTRMYQNLAWTQDLGQAFQGQQKQVMDTIQAMRQKAYASGNLQSSSQQTVTQQGTTIVIQPANPQVVYVPAYDPTVVYGAAWAPAYWYYPAAVFAPWPGWVPGAGAFAFGAGVAVGAAWTGAWGCAWDAGHVVATDPYYHRYGATPYYGAQGSYHGVNGSYAHYGDTSAAYNRNTGELHSYNAATGVERSGQAYHGAYGEGVQGEHGSVAHAGNTTASYNRNTGEVHSYNSATGNAHYGNTNNMSSWDHGSAGHYGGGSYGGAERGYGGGGGWGGGGGEAAASQRGWASRGGGGGRRR